ncbi:hypothetical protein MB02_14280 [Croceicoccus estronivorus]|uniref:FliM/FliN family flagellar motor C-terminal domain-containing protein n=1 Tax=Croceicoccus estronivorus TaxID=1172626 RepID=UPI0008359662|nr:FliM/FliN family flagellar motor C-terminal domain-containing protein [Croceicoccus estronivorus]OCC22930.1 hypothetical protein MB02_14280 [Croceicoccus estronivorus]
MPTASLWLPETAFTGPSSVAPVAELLGRWSDEWLVKGRLTAPFAWQKAPAPHGSGNAADRPCQLTLTTGSEPLLAQGLLGREMGAHDLKTTGDMMLVRELAQTVRDDLARRIEALFADFKGPADGGAHPRYRLPFMLNEGSEIFTLEIAAPLLIAMARHRAGTPRKRAQPDLRNRAIENQPIAIGALIGRTSIALNDLEKLGPGDVITLQTDAADLLDMQAGNTIIAHKAASIVLAGEHFQMRIERPIDQW